MTEISPQEAAHNAKFMMPSKEVLKKYFGPVTKEHAEQMLKYAEDNGYILPDVMKHDLARIIAEGVE